MLMPGEGAGGKPGSYCISCSKVFILNQIVVKKLRKICQVGEPCRTRTLNLVIKNQLIENW